MGNKIQQLKDADGNNIYPIAYAQGGCKMDLLWTNPSPTSAFAAQTVALNLSDYKLLIVVANAYAPDSNSHKLNTIVLKDLGKQIMGISSNDNAYRDIISVSNSQIVFDSGQYTGTYGTAVTDDNRAVPIYIYGIKMSYVVPTTVHGLQYVEVE